MTPPTQLWMDAPRFGLLCAATLLGVGLACGVWKYRCIRRSPEACAPIYVDIAHRAALMYAFTTTLLAMLARDNAWPAAVCSACIAGAVSMFSLSIASYVLHGWLRDTDNQFRTPMKLGGRPVHAPAVDAFMGLKTVVEAGAVLVLASGQLLR